MEKDSLPGFYKKLAAPAQRAMQLKSIMTLQQLAKYSEAELLQLHGIGKTSIPKLQAALAEKNLSFKK